MTDWRDQKIFDLRARLKLAVGIVVILLWTILFGFEARYEGMMPMWVAAIVCFAILGGGVWVGRVLVGDGNL